MHTALELAAKARGQTSPNPMVGAVVIDAEGHLAGIGYHERAGMPHAEAVALEEAGEQARGGTLYVTLEPCCHHGRTPPCTEAVLRSGVARVVVATVDPNPVNAGAGIERLRKAGIDVDCGVLEGEARRLNESFITYHLLGRPFTILKWAMSLDGRTSSDSGDSKWISSDRSRTYVHRLRSQVDAIAVGAGTVYLDNPRLNVRLKNFQDRQPLRLVFDGRLRTPLGARCLDRTHGGETWILCSENASTKRRQRLAEEGHVVLPCPGRGFLIDIEQALRLLADRGLQSILFEGGRRLHTSLIAAGLADRIVAFTSPRIIGGELPTTPTGPLGLRRIRQALNLKNVRYHQFGQDFCTEGYLNALPRQTN